MPYPASFKAVTVTGTFQSWPDGVGANGTILFKNTKWLINSVDDVVVAPFQTKLTLDESGAFSVVLPAVDGLDLTYSIIVSIGGKSLKGEITLSFDGPDTVDLSDILSPYATPTNGQGPVSVSWSEITDKPATFPGDPVHWADLLDKPTTFAPSTHSHAISDVTSLASTLSSKADTSITTALDTRLDKLDNPTVSLTDASTVLVDAAAGPSQRVVVAGNRAIGKPSNGFAGQRLILTVVQDATGSRAWTLATGYRLRTGDTITPSTTANARDKMVVQYDAGDDVWDVLAFLRGDGDSAEDAPAASAAQFRPEDFGAVGDDTTNDQDAINACITAAATWATTTGNYYAEIIFDPAKVYLVSGATIKGGAGQGNAQIPLPAISTTGKKLTLVFRGGIGNDSFGHWEQTVGQVAGATIRTTLTGLSVDGTWGAPSVVGAPTAGTFSAGNAFTNLRFVIDGVNIVAPYNPGIIAWDLQKCAHTKVISAGAFGNAGPAGSPPLTTIPTNDLGIGLRTSRNLNNAVVDVDTYACEGFYYAAIAAEHFTALRFLAVYCHTGLYITANGGDYHGGSIVYACMERVNNCIEVAGGSSGTFPLIINLLDTETVIDYVINDPLDALTGSANWMSSDASPVAPSVNSAKLFKLVSVRRQHAPGAKTAPSVPATTVAHTNTFWRDCAVTVSGGTVTGIAVDGQSTGITSGTVIVPTGKSITLTYSSAPSWNWVAL
jgi:hypothetical protein